METYKSKCSCNNLMASLTIDFSLMSVNSKKPCIVVWPQVGTQVWFTKLCSALLRWGFKGYTSDNFLFIKYQGFDVLFLLVSVDDILISCNNHSLINKTISQLNSTFALKALGSVNYFLGFEVFQDSTGLYLTQSKYIVDLLKKLDMFDSKPCSTPINDGSKLFKNDEVPLENATIYRSTIRALQYLCYTQ